MLLNSDQRVRRELHLGLLGKLKPNVPALAIPQPLVETADAFEQFAPCNDRRTGTPYDIALDQKVAKHIAAQARDRRAAFVGPTIDVDVKIAAVDEPKPARVAREESHLP